MEDTDAVDGKPKTGEKTKPVEVGIVEIPSCTGFYASVVQDF